MEENNRILIYTDGSGLTRIDVKLEEDTLWLTQAQMCELYQTSKSNVSEHIKHIFEEGELQEEAVVRKFRTTAADGKSYLMTFYNLDMIIALGYRVRSIIATRFRQWATERLKEYIVKGFTLDDERLKKLGGGGYWKELLERIRDIRATEKVLYRQVLEIYATSIDYDPRASISQEFFKKVQNKIHYAIHGLEFVNSIWLFQNNVLAWASGKAERYLCTRQQATKQAVALSQVLFQAIYSRKLN
jgi:hypothetical protein